jgi:hypothetical protein
MKLPTIKHTQRNDNTSWAIPGETRETLARKTNEENE